MDRHLRPQCGHLLGEPAAGPHPQPLDPFAEHRPRRLEEARDRLVLEAVRVRHGREPGPVEDLVPVGVADAGEAGPVGQRALQRMALAQEDLAEGRGRRGGSGTPSHSRANEARRV